MCEDNLNNNSRLYHLRFQMTFSRNSYYRRSDNGMFINNCNAIASNWRTRCESSFIVKFTDRHNLDRTRYNLQNIIRDLWRPNNVLAAKSIYSHKIERRARQRYLPQVFSQVVKKNDFSLFTGYISQNSVPCSSLISTRTDRRWGEGLNKTRALTPSWILLRPLRLL